MADTPGIPVPLLEAGSSDPTLHFNNAAWIEAVVGFGELKSSTLTTPPGSPADGDLYAIAAGSTPTGLWAGQAGKLAAYRAANGGWLFYTPWRGFFRRSTASSALIYWSGSAFATHSGSGGSGITAVLDDPTPALGGPLDGNGNTYTEMSAKVDSWTGSTRTWGGHPLLMFNGTTTTLTLPKAAPVGANFAVWATAASGVVTVAPEVGATLVTGLFAGNQASLKTAGRRIWLPLAVESNTGTAAVWCAGGTHTQ